MSGGKSPPSRLRASWILVSLVSRARAAQRVGVADPILAGIGLVDEGLEVQLGFGMAGLEEVSWESVRGSGLLYRCKLQASDTLGDFFFCSGVDRPAKT